MDALNRSMRWYETRFGHEYDLDLFNIVAVSDFNMGAMENKSLNVFNDKYILADPETATDRSEEHTSELQSLMRISYAVFCLKKKKIKNKQITNKLKLTNSNQEITSTHHKYKLQVTNRLITKSKH